MKKLQDYKFWFIVGSQFLYGPEALKAVEEDAKKMVEGLNASGKLPAKIEFKAVGTTAEAAEDLANVKTRFFKGRNAVRGSGIGLALVDSIMQALDGTLDLRSTLGRGTVVTLGLPVYRR